MLMSESAVSSCDRGRQYRRSRDSKRRAGERTEAYCALLILSCFRSVDLRGDSDDEAKLDPTARTRGSARTLRDSREGHGWTHA